MENPWILPSKYHSIQPLKISTFEKIYFLPQEISVEEILKQINIGGFRIHSKDIQNVELKNHINQKNIDHSTKLRDVVKEQEESFVKI